MNRKTKIVALVGGLALLGGGVSFAAIPDSGTGTYTMCLPNAGTYKAPLFIDKQAGASCQFGYSEKTFNQTGPAGPQGPAGATGATGPVGPTGPGYVAYYREGETLTVGPGGTQYATAYCDPLDTALSGNGELLESIGSSGFADVAISSSARPPNQHNWVTVFHNGSATETYHVRALATCFRYN